MIRGKNVTIEDRGFFTSVKKIGGVSRQTITIGLSCGIDEETLGDLVAGSISVLDETGNAVRSFDGPFRVVSLQLTLSRESEAQDVSALAEEISTLSAALNTERSAKESAVAELEKLGEQFLSFKNTVAGKLAAAGMSLTGEEEAADGQE